jgi:hypothetical protein
VLNQRARKGVVGTPPPATKDERPHIGRTGCCSVRQSWSDEVEVGVEARALIIRLHQTWFKPEPSLSCSGDG